MADALKERIALLQVGEAQGRLKPEHKAELERYRQQGLIKPAGGQSGGQSMPQVTAQTRSQAMAKIAASHMLRDQLRTVRDLYDRNLKGVGPGSLLEYLPTPANRRFDAAAQGLLPLARQAFRVPGSGADSDSEQMALIKALIPKASAYDTENEQRMNQLQQMLEGTEREWGPIAGQQPKAVSPTIKRVR